FISMKQNEGANGADLMMRYKTNIDRPVAAILSLNTVAHTIGAAGVGSESVKVFGEAYFGIISAILTLLILVLSEIIPKTIGASYWRQLAMPSAKVIRVLIFITYPLVWLSELLTKCFAPKIQPLTVSREEVVAMVGVGEEEGVFQKQESQVLKSFLKLESVKAEDIMTPFVVVFSSPSAASMRQLHDNPEFAKFSRIPIYGSEREYITGYVRKADVLDNICSDRSEAPLSSIQRPILFFSENDKVSDIWQSMLEKKEHISVINDEYGCMRGIVTMEDVIETMLGVEIVDECDTDADLQAVAKEKYSHQRPLVW
ncbi:MAG: CNNM domain-containing protein, partial [Bacteroides sp.]|nr:CNNM domain-containing protein [Bacteroides sp.]